MRKLLITLCALTALAAARSAHANPGNLIVNPDFVGSAGENCYCGVTGWAFSTALGTTATTGVPALGLQAANNTGSSLAGQGFWDNGTAPAGITTAGTIQVGPPGTPLATNELSQTLTGLTVGTNYAISYLENARAAVNYGVPFSVEVLVGSSIGVQSHNDSVVGGSNPFRTETGMFEATSSSEVFEFFVTGNGDETALLTNVSVTDVPEPQAVGLFGAGLIGLIYVRRKLATEATA